MSSVEAYMTVAEYAAHRGVSDSYVRRLRRERRLVEGPDKLIDVLASNGLLDATTDPVRGGDRTGKNDAHPQNLPTNTVAPSDIVDLREAMRRERLAKARTAELELGEQAKQLTRVKHVDREVFTLVRQALERLRTIPSRLRTKIAAETDPRACEAMLDAEVAQVCEEMQAAARAMMAAASADAPAEREAA